MDIPMGGIRIIKKLEKINKDDANFCNNEYISNKKIVEKLTTTPIIIEKNKFSTYSFIIIHLKIFLIFLKE
jgi:hypothetical protein